MEQALTTIQDNKTKIMKFLITISAAFLIIYLIYKLIDITDSRMQIDTFITIYSLLFLSIILIHEIRSSILPEAIIENLKLITHCQGKGLIYIVISIIYIPHRFEKFLNYAAYITLIVGILCELAVFNLVGKNNSNYDNNQTMDDSTKSIKLVPSKKDNPYDIQEDF
jgi:hypothetical protein